MSRNVHCPPHSVGGAAPTEWHLQTVLTEQWAAEGAYLDGERLMLVAWEVMTDWRVNDARKHWNRPSLDFLFLDAAGQLVATEFKRQIGSPRESWSALCQVTHRAHHLALTYTPERLATIHRACSSGAHGRVPATSHTEPLPQQHQDFFGSRGALRLTGLPLRRTVAAERFADCWPRIADQFTSDPEIALTELRRYRGRSSRDIARFLDLAEPADRHLMAPTVCTLQVSTPSGC